MAGVMDPLPYKRGLLLYFNSAEPEPINRPSSSSIVLVLGQTASTGRGRKHSPGHRFHQTLGAGSQGRSRSARGRAARRSVPSGSPCIGDTVRSLRGEVCVIRLHGSKKILYHRSKQVGCVTSGTTIVDLDVTYKSWPRMRQPCSQ